MLDAVNLELIARQLSAHSLRIRQGIAQTKRSITDAHADIRETVAEIEGSRQRLTWLASRLTALRAALSAESLSEDDRRDHEDELAEWEDEELEEREHLCFLTEEHAKMLVHRQALVDSLMVMVGRLLQVRTQERTLAAMALRIGIAQVHRRKVLS